MEWIDRRKQEPPAGQYVLAYWQKNEPADADCTIAVCKPSRHHDFSHWMPLPAPPTRKVTIEIDEETARVYAKTVYPEGAIAAEVSAACAAALETSR